MRIHRATRRTGFLAAILLALGLLVVAPAPEAAAAVQSCSSSTPVASRPTLRYGDTGSCVKVLQNLLLAKGVSIGTSYADGKFGPGTLLGVRRYQQSRLDLAIDGVVGPYTWNRLVNGGGTAYSVYRGPNTSSRVILSFDDCPTSLSAFKATVVGARNLGIALVLAPTGNCISAGRFNASYARQYGHWVINHSVEPPGLHHPLDVVDLLPARVAGCGHLVRPPALRRGQRAVRNAFATKSMRIWLWNVDTNDWRGKTRSQVVSYVVTYAKPGNTVLMHMHWNGFNTTALSSMKSGLAAKGIGVCRNLGATTPTRPSHVNC